MRSDVINSIPLYNMNVMVTFTLRPIFYHLISPHKSRILVGLGGELDAVAENSSRNHFVFRVKTTGAAPGSTFI